MATDHFSELWADVHCDDELVRGLALKFYDAGRLQAQTEIRQALVAEADSFEQLNNSVANAMRNFVRLALKGGE